MATTNAAVHDAMALLRQRRFALYEVSRKRNEALTFNKRANVPELNAQIVAARTAWLQARADVVAALAELEPEPPTSQTIELP